MEHMPDLNDFYMCIEYDPNTGEIIRLNSNIEDPNSLEITQDELELYRRFPQQVSVDLDTKTIVRDETAHPYRFKPYEDIVAYIRLRRDKLLEKTDWTILPDSPKSAQQIIDWKNYRQALRDLPAQATDKASALSLVWPEEPA